MIMLNTGSVFAEILEKSQSIILTGGTMKPITEFQDLFKTLSDNQIERYS